MNAFSLVFKLLEVNQLNNFFDKKVSSSLVLRAALRVFKPAVAALPVFFMCGVSRWRSGCGTPQVFQACGEVTDSCDRGLTQLDAQTFNFDNLLLFKTKTVQVKESGQKC